MSEIKHMVAGDNTADFEYFHDGALWYRVLWTDLNTFEPKQFTFPVPIEDIGTATFNRTEKALLMMRYIRKHLKTVESKEN